MSITREQIRDLRPGDVVELRDSEWPEGTVVRGPLTEVGADLAVASDVITWGGEPYCATRRTLTVVSRAPRLYVNHPRTEPVPGDVVRSADDDHGCNTWRWCAPGGRGVWVDAIRFDTWAHRHLPARLRLLVDGDTGQVVTS